MMVRILLAASAVALTLGLGLAASAPTRAANEWGIPGEEKARFDAKVHRHHHLVCTRCGRVVDLENRRLDDVALPSGKPHGFEVHDFSVQIMGICPDCRKKKPNPRIRRSSKTGGDDE